MLFVHDGERQLFESDILFDQGVRADQQVDGAVGEGCQQGAAGGRRSAPEQHADDDAERPQQRLHDFRMLPGEDLSRRQQHRLQADVRHVVYRHRCDHRLAGADVTLQQAVHRLWAGDVLEDLPRRRALGIRQLERQRRDESPRRRLIEGDLVSGMGLAGALRLLHRNLVEKHLLESEPAAGVIEDFQRVGEVDLPDGVGSGHEPATLHELGREYLLQLVRQPEQGPDLRSEPARGQPFGFRIDGHDASRVAGIIRDLFVLGVFHEKATVEVNLPRHENLIPLVKIVRNVRLVKPDHVQLSRVVGDGRLPHVFARGELPLDLVHASPNGRPHARPDPGNRHHAAEILVAAREVEQQIANGSNPEALELAAVRGVDPGDGGHRIIQGKPWHDQAIR